MKQLSIIFGISTILGILLMLSGVFTYLAGSSEYTLPLIISGVVLIFLSSWRLVIIYASHSGAEEKKKEVQT
jgi:hypothetical protein